MAKLPYSRVVNVTLSRNQNFPSRRGFGVPLFLTTKTIAGKLDAANRTRVYGSMDEVAVDFVAGDEFYKAAQEAFSQNPRPMQLKAGFCSTVPATGTNPNIKADLDAIVAQDSDWYWLTIEAPFRDKQAIMDGIAEWTEAQNKIAMLDSNDAGLQAANNTTAFAARQKNKFVRTAVFYHTDVNEYPGLAYAASLATRNFDNSNSAYTGKFKKLAGVGAVNLGSAAIQAITGFTPALGQSTTAGHNANTIVDIGGQIFVVEGSTLTPNVFIDEIHATDWIIARTEEETLGVLLNNDRVPFTDQGMQLLASGARIVMRSADRAGLIANDVDTTTGDYAPSVVFTIPSVFDVPESQRKARIAPNIQVRFRYAGAVHYTTINYNMAF